MAGTTKNPAEKPLKKGAKKGTKNGTKTGVKNGAENASKNPPETAPEETPKVSRMGVKYGGGCIDAIVPVTAGVYADDPTQKTALSLLHIPTEEEYNVEMDVAMDKETNENKILVTIQGSVWLKDDHPELDMQTMTLEKICDQLTDLLNDAMTHRFDQPVPYDHPIPFDLRLHGPCESSPDMEVVSPDGYVDLVFEDCKLDVTRLLANVITSPSEDQKQFIHLPENVTRFCDLMPIYFAGDEHSDKVPTTALFTLKIPFIHNGDVTMYGVRSLIAEDTKE